MIPFGRLLELVLLKFAALTTKLAEQVVVESGGGRRGALFDLPMTIDVMQ